ncbi:unnamed protein product [Effrenium voratum]|nr:unnamed protein product [Effrenium voratum]
MARSQNQLKQASRGRCDCDFCLTQQLIVATAAFGDRTRAWAEGDASLINPETVDYKLRAASQKNFIRTPCDKYVRLRSTLPCVPQAKQHVRTQARSAFDWLRVAKWYLLTLWPASPLSCAVCPSSQTQGSETACVMASRCRCSMSERGLSTFNTCL